MDPSCSRRFFWRELGLPDLRGQHGILGRQVGNLRLQDDYSGFQASILGPSLRPLVMEIRSLRSLTARVGFWPGARRGGLLPILPSL